MSEKLIPFDLEVALKHPERVRHADGLTARRVIHLPETDPDHRVAVLWSGSHCLVAYTEDGRNRTQGANPTLFLTPEPKWVPWSHPDEIPDGVWFRLKGSTRADLITRVDGAEVYLNPWVSLRNLFDNYECHLDRRHKGAWNVCGKEAK